MPRLAAPPAGLTRGEAKCVEALAYLEPGNPAGTGGWQSMMYLALSQKAKDGDMAHLAARGLVERRESTARGVDGLGVGRVAQWRLSRAGWALARACGWPAWADEEQSA